MNIVVKYVILTDSSTLEGLNRNININNCDPYCGMTQHVFLPFFYFWCKQIVP